MIKSIVKAMCQNVLFDIAKENSSKKCQKIIQVK